MTTTHPFDSSQVLTPMVTGMLPASKPIIARGQVYCGNDFRQRAVAWFMAEQKRAAGADTSAAADKTAAKAAAAKKTRRITAPTRVQPPRAAKRKAGDAPDPTAPPRKRLRIVLAKAQAVVRTPALPAPPPSYTLSSVYAHATAAQFQAGLDTVLDTKRAALTSGCHWSTSLYPSPSPSPSPPVTSTSARRRTSSYSTPRSAWCPIMAEPLACIDRAYCLHSIGRLTPELEASSLKTFKTTKTSPTTTTTTTTTPSTLSRPQAPEATMSPPWTPPPEIVLKARVKEFAEMRHMQERTVEFGGLWFAVDMCDGSMRVWMV